MNIHGAVAIVTGAGSGIGQALAIRLAKHGIKALGLVDRNDSVSTVAEAINEANEDGQKIAVPFLGDTTDEAFQKQTFDQIIAEYGTPTICVPAAGITRDQFAVKLDKETGRAVLYPREKFLAPTPWCARPVLTRPSVPAPAAESWEVRGSAAISSVPHFHAPPPMRPTTEPPATSNSSLDPCNAPTPTSR